jgi:hypothetical protein
MSLSISSPLNDATVSQTFDAWGTWSSTPMSIGSFIQDDTGHQVTNGTGTRVDPPSQSGANWQFHFDGVRVTPDGKMDTLVVGAVFEGGKGDTMVTVSIKITAS